MQQNSEPEPGVSICVKSVYPLHANLLTANSAVLETARQKRRFLPIKAEDAAGLRPAEDGTGRLGSVSYRSALAQRRCSVRGGTRCGRSGPPGALLIGCWVFWPLCDWLKRRDRQMPVSNSGSGEVPPPVTSYRRFVFFVILIFNILETLLTQRGIICLLTAALQKIQQKIQIK